MSNITSTGTHTCPGVCNKPVSGGQAVQRWLWNAGVLGITGMWVLARGGGRPAEPACWWMAVAVTAWRQRSCPLCDWQGRWVQAPPISCCRQRVWQQQWQANLPTLALLYVSRQFHTVRARKQIHSTNTLTYWSLLLLDCVILNCVCPNIDKTQILHHFSEKFMVRIYCE